MAKHYKAKICKSCGEEFVPRSGVQKICDDCRAKEADRPRRAPTAAMLREYNRRQKETIRKLQEEVATMKAKALAPQSALFAEIKTLTKAIEQQREMISEGQRSVAVMGHRNHELRKGIAATIEALQGILKEVNGREFVLTVKEKQTVEGKKRPVMVDVDKTYSMDTVKYAKYQLTFK